MGKTLKRNENRALSAVQIGKLLDAVSTIRDDALIRLGLSVGLRVSEVVNIRVSEIDFERGTVKIWDEKKDKWRMVYPSAGALSAVRKYLSTFNRPPQLLFPISAKTAERVIQGYSQQALGFTISWHALRTTYVSRSVEEGQSIAVVIQNTGDKPATILEHYTKLSDDTIKRLVEAHPVIPSAAV